MTALLDSSGVALAGRLDPTDLSLFAGKLAALIGPNGSGKTSLLRALAAIERSAGRSLIDGEDIARAAPARRRAMLGFLPASREMVWPIPARAVVALGAQRGDPQWIETLLDLLELGPLADRPTDRLSTGERARVLLARALAARPRVLLLDEPLSNLDPYWALRIIEILREIAGDSGCTVLLSLHDLGLAEQFDRLLLMNRGRIVADAAPQLILGSTVLSDSFGIVRSGNEWRISQMADRRSSR